MRRQAMPAPELADHDVTMAMLRKRAGEDPDALAEVEEWGRRRVGRLAVLRRFAALLGRGGILGGEADRVTRDFVIEQCFAIATRHGLDMMDYEYDDSDTGPISTLMGIDLHAVELDGTETASPFPDEASERAFLAEVAGKGHGTLGRMARDAVIPDRARVVI
ncbi:MAG: hypothetical protein EB824_02460 [Thaumarchaeota archaeon S15]|nr:MAG: hypothetical protein EB833_02780 [Thaumarchaeota archaeon S13]RNJ74940.1 MAG: hypothetical protein EB824_02460 [Thaumarchaeota archaeon S15]